MIYQLPNKKQIIRKKKLIKVIIILALFLVLVFSGVLNIFVKLVNYVGYPIWQAKKVVVEGGSNFSYLTRSKSSSLEDIKLLQKENYNLKIEMINYKILEKENAELKTLLGRIPAHNNWILASTLVKPGNSPYDTMIIDLGSKNGIKEKDKVYANGDIPVGTISKVYSQTSQVELYSNPGRTTRAVIDGSNTDVNLVGRGGGNFEMAVPFGLDVSTGTVVKLPGINSEIIAIVDKEAIDKTNPDKKIILHAPVNIQNQEWVLIKKNKWKPFYLK